MVDLRNTSVLIVVWAMPGCGACDQYLPEFTKRVNALKKRGAPLHIYQPGDVLEPGQIPVMFYDAAAENEELQAFADKLGVTATPTTCVMTKRGTTKVEGAIPPGDIDKLLVDALNANQ
jgi:hypothetical protein